MFLLESIVGLYFLQLLMKSNKTILLTAMVHHVCKGEVEFHDICEILKVSLPSCLNFKKLKGYIILHMLYM